MSAVTARDFAKDRAKNLDQPERDKAKVILDILEGQEEEIRNAMLVSTLVFTVAAAAILQPNKSIIVDSEHTDLYASLCCMSLVANLGSVLFGTAILRYIRNIKLYFLDTMDETLHYVQAWEATVLYHWPILLMWCGSITITAALAINVNTVFGETDMPLSTAAITMITCSVLLFLIVMPIVLGRLESVQQKNGWTYKASYHFYDDNDGYYSEGDSSRDCDGCATACSGVTSRRTGSREFLG